MLLSDWSKVGRYVCVLESKLPDTVISISYEFRSDALYTGREINKLSEYSKKIYLYEKTESKAENKVDFIEWYKSKDKIKRRKSLFIWRSHHDNKTTTKMIEIQMISTIKSALWKKILANK